MSYHHLTPTERGQVQALFNEGKSQAHIARVLGRSPSAICRELHRNGTQKGYDAAQAQARYEKRREACRPAAKLDYMPLWNLVFDKCTDGWTPETIHGRIPLDYPDDPKMRISHETIYQAIYRDPRMHCLIESLPQARRKRRKRGQGKTRRGPAIANRTGIEERPPEAEARSRFGDWEGDTVVGAKQYGYIATLVERKSLFLVARKCLTKEAREVAGAVIEGLADLPASWLKTLTFDNGTEFARHETIAQALPLDIYFARPYASWQRGTNENTNGLLRRYLPKGIDLREVTQEQLDHIVTELNNRPRKKLGYRTPNEIFLEQRQLALNALRPGAQAAGSPPRPALC